MKQGSNQIDQALRAKTRADLVACLPSGHVTLGLPEVQRLTQHLIELAEPRQPLRLAILHTYTSDLLDPYVKFEAILQGFEPLVYHAPYGAVVQEAASGAGLASHRPDVTLLLLRWEDLDPELAGSLHALKPADRDALAARARGTLIGYLTALRKTVGGHLLVTLLPPLHAPGLGDFDVNAPSSEHAWRAAIKAGIVADMQADIPSTTLLDLDETLLALGRERFFDLRWWYTAQFPFAPAAAREIARRVIAVAVVLKLPRAKVIALDADNTLWGGIVGEDGIDGIALGPEYPGNVYVAFQRRLLDFQQRGFVLALCSKNNEADVLEVLRRHPHQLLREEHFAAMRVNWEPKPQNLEALADELGLGLESFVFIDDSAHECLVIRQSLPAVEVVQIPERVLEIPACLDRRPRLEIVTLTDEDQRKTEMYVQERKRRDFAASTTDVGAYLKSLQMEISVSLDDARHVGRIAQLTQKTNQFNLTTRRYTEDEVARMIRADDWLLAHFSLRDIFGDSGIVGVALTRLAGDVAELDTLLMSCRVIGRKAETAFLDTILAVLRQRGIQTLVADYIPTKKNGLVANLLPEHGFTLRADGRYERSVKSSVSTEPLPMVIRVTGASAPRAV